MGIPGPRSHTACLYSLSYGLEWPSWGAAIEITEIRLILTLSSITRNKFPAKTHFSSQPSLSQSAEPGPLPVRQRDHYPVESVHPSKPDQARRVVLTSFSQCFSVAPQHDTLLFSTHHLTCKNKCKWSGGGGIADLLRRRRRRWCRQTTRKTYHLIWLQKSIIFSPSLCYGLHWPT